jgi:hypothetical protein
VCYVLLKQVKFREGRQVVRRDKFTTIMKGDYTVLYGRWAENHHSGPALLYVIELCQQLSKYGSLVIGCSR